MRRLLVCVWMTMALSIAASQGQAADDIVAYAQDATRVAGNWVQEADGSAAGGRKLSSADHGWSTTSGPLASPNDYIEIPITVASNTPYHVWVRLRAGSDSKWNDSVWLQFNDAVGTDSNALHRIGTSGGLLLNLEQCSNCGTSGWGWVDGAYWLGQTNVVQFASAGTHTVRIQIREDGAQIDQVLLSPSTYFSRSPGTTTNDGTLLPQSGASVTPAGSGSGPAYLGVPVTLPGTVNAQDYDTGGVGTSYWDSTSGNTGGAYRSGDVDLEPSSDGGNNIGWIAAGEWLNYSVNVSASGNYNVELRVASPSGGGSMHVGFNGSNVWSVALVPATGGWQNWTTVNVPVTLNAGQQLITLLFDTAGFNINRITVASGSGSGSGSSGGSSGGSGSPTTPPSSGGSTIAVAPGQSLQAAINDAKAGDTILLQPGAVYEGGLILPAKGGSDYITIRSAAPDYALPGEGVRITPAYASQLPKIQGGVAGLPAIMTDLGAHHWRLQFLELIDTWPYGDILALGDGSWAQSSLSTVAHDLIVDRVYIHGVPGQDQKRGIALNSASTTITNSYISEIKLTNGDAQAIAGWNGPGPYTITNNYLEATGENFLLGGSDPPIYGLIPSDIVFRGNTVTKQTWWRNSSYAVKNHIELKNAQRVTIDGNVIEYNWNGGQPGHSIMLTPRNQDGGAPWSVVRQIQITNNVIRHVAGVLNVLGTDYRYPTQPLTGIVFRNNLVLDLSGANWGGAAQLLLTSGGNDITIDHNTVFTDGSSAVYADGPQVTGFVFTNNIFHDNIWGVMGAGASEGNGTLSIFFPGATFRRNVIIGGQSSLYPADNYFPASVNQVGFVDPNGNYRLSSSSSYVNAATDGAAIGANIGTINAATGTSY